VYPTFSSLSLARSWVLNDLFVDPTARGTGAGRALLRVVNASAAQAGAAYVALETAEDNHRAQGLYEVEGFTAETGYRHYTRPTDWSQVKS
jgi:ribosomal protein S18 acetylase RimI-like enzyme